MDEVLHVLDLRMDLFQSLNRSVGFAKAGVAGAAWRIWALLIATGARVWRGVSVGALPCGLRTGCSSYAQAQTAAQVAGCCFEERCASSTGCRCRKVLLPACHALAMRDVAFDLVQVLALISGRTPCRQRIQICRRVGMPTTRPWRR